LQASKVEIFLEFLHKTQNAALGSQLDAWLLKKLSQGVIFLKNTVVVKLLVRVDKKVTTLKKLAVSTLAKAPMETATTKATHKDQDTRSWPNMLLAKSTGLMTSLLHGNLLQPMVTLV